MDKKDSIVAKQILGFVVATQIGFGILTLPSSLAEKAGHDGWIATLLAGIIFAGASIVIISLQRRFTDKSIIEINRLMYGKYFGALLNLFFITYTYLLATLVLRLFSELTKIMILRATPNVVLITFLIVPAVYLTSSGFKVICRFSNVIFVVVTFTIFFLVLAIPESRISYLMPVGKAGTGTILKVMTTTVTSYLGIELVPMVYDTISDKDKVMKYALLGHSYTVFFFTVVVAGTTSFFGEDIIKELLFPIFSLSRAYRAPIFERLDLFFTSIWLPAMGTTVVSFFFATHYSIKKLVKIKNEKILLTVLFSSSILLSFQVKDFNEAIKYIELISYYGMMIVFCLLFTYVLSIIVKKRC